MKTHPFFLLSLALSLAACDQKADFLNQADLLRVAPAVHTADATTAQFENLKSDPCVELSATHWLTGFGICKPIVEVEPAPDTEVPSTHIIRGPGTHYSIEASGDAMSELFARGLTQLNLTIDSRTHKVSGTMTTTFFNGEVLELKVDAGADMRIEGGKMQLDVTMNAAELRTGFGFFELVYGHVVLTLPIAPEGPVAITIETLATLCTTEID